MTMYEYMVREGIDLSLGLSRTMSESSGPNTGQYVLATGTGAVHRLWVLHEVYGAAGKRILLHAGLRPGMKVADFGCGVGMTTRMLSEMAGRFGTVLGIDVDASQLKEAQGICDHGRLSNASFLQADACDTGLPADSFDVVYCRLLLLHLPGPQDALCEMCRVLKPGGLLVVEDGDLSSAESVPPTALNAFSDLFTRLGRARGLDYSLAKNLFHMVKSAGVVDPEIEIHQPAIVRGDGRFLLKWTVEEAGAAMVSSGILTAAQLNRTLAEMVDAVEDPDVLILPPRMSIVWGRKSSDGLQQLTSN